MLEMMYGVEVLLEVANLIFIKLLIKFNLKIIKI